VAATDRAGATRAAGHPERGEGSRRPSRVFAWLGSLLGLLGFGAARAADLPEDTAEGLLHVYHGGGVTAYGPAFLVRKSVADRFSLTGSYYLDAVSNASIDVVTTASKYKETRHEFALSGDYVYRDSTITLGGSTSHEPDYTANRFSLDISQEVFGGMTTVALGFTRGDDKVEKKDSPEFSDKARHWQYRLGMTQILTPKWIMSLNAEAISDDGYLGSPYRSARVFGAAVPERNPRTRSARALMLRVKGDLGSRDAISASYRYYRDTWEVKGHTFELGYSRYFQDTWLADAYLRYYTQGNASFYSDNAQSETLYVSRNRQLSTFNDVVLGTKVSWLWKKEPGKYEIKLHGTLEYMHFNYKDFTDLRTGDKYSHGAGIFQLFVTGTF